MGALKFCRIERTLADFQSNVFSTDLLKIAPRSDFHHVRTRPSGIASQAVCILMRLSL